MKTESNVGKCLELLHQQFGGAMMITIKQAAKPLGLSPGTARNRASKGNFPVPLVRQGTSDARVRLVDLAKYLAGETVAKKGRPTKAEQIARRYKEVSHGH